MEGHTYNHACCMAVRLQINELGKEAGAEQVPTSHRARACEEVHKEIPITPVYRPVIHFN